MKLEGIFKIIFILLLIIIFIEIGSYLLIIKKKPTSQEINDLNKIINNSYYDKFLKFEYDKEKNRIYLKDYTPRDFIAWRKSMGIDFASWFTMSNITKSQIDYITMSARLKGSIGSINTKFIDPNGNEILYFVLIANDGSKNDFYFPKEFLQKAKFVTTSNGIEKTLNWKTDLKNNDKIIIEYKVDYTKPPNSPLFIIEAKVIKL